MLSARMVGCSSQTVVPRRHMCQPHRLRFRGRGVLGPLVPSLPSSVGLPTSVATTPLFEEKRDTRREALGRGYSDQDASIGLAPGPDSRATMTHSMSSSGSSGISPIKAARSKGSGSAQRLAQVYSRELLLRPPRLPEPQVTRRSTKAISDRNVNPHARRRFVRNLKNMASSRAPWWRRPDRQTPLARPYEKIVIEFTKSSAGIFQPRQLGRAQAAPSGRAC